MMGGAISWKLPKERKWVQELSRVVYESRARWVLN